MKIVISGNPSLETAVKISAFISDETISKHWKIIMLYLCHLNIPKYAWVIKN